MNNANPAQEGWKRPSRLSRTGETGLIHMAIPAIHNLNHRASYITAESAG
jgi:hypothetical protein